MIYVGFRLLFQSVLLKCHKHKINFKIYIIGTLDVSLSNLYSKSAFYEIDLYEKRKYLCLFTF